MQDQNDEDVDQGEHPDPPQEGDEMIELPWDEDLSLDLDLDPEEVLALQLAEQEILQQEQPGPKPQCPRP